MEKTNLIINSTVDIGDNIEIETNGKGRPFSSRFIEAGVAHYEQFGDVLITKETLDKFVHSMVGCPVIIKHKDITDENADKERVGVVSRVWFNEFDGWYWCEGIIWDKQAIDLVKNQGWNVSCTYDFESDKQPKTHNGKKVDMEFTDGEFLHLALVPNPRYERANIVINSKGDTVENDRWITVKPNGEDEKGRHLLIKDGEDIGDAMRRQWGVYDKRQDKETQKKDEKNQYLKKGDLETDKVYKLGKHYIKPKEDENGNLYFDDNIGVWGGQQYILKTDLKNIERVEKYDKLTDKELKFLSEKEDNQPTKQVIDRVYKKEDKEEKTVEEIKQDYINGKISADEAEKLLPKDVDTTSLVIAKEQKQQGGKDPFDKTDSKDSYYEPDMEEHYTPAYEENIQKDYEEFMKDQKEKKDPESPFGEGVEHKHTDRGMFWKSKGTDIYTKGNKGVSVEEFGENGGKYQVSFYEGTKRVKSSKTYATKSGMEKAVREHLQGGLNKEQKALSTKTNLEAAKTRYNDVLKKYNEADRKRWQQGITPQEYHQAWVDAEKYKKELTGARREYAESIMSNFQEVEDNPYEQRLEDKKMRYAEMAAKTQAESNRVAKQSSQMLDAIPMGQPILVGHYSERSDRNYRNRAFGKMEKSWELSKKADYYANKSASVGTAGISSDDANAIAKLAQKYKSGVDSAEKRRIIDRVIDLHTRATSTAPASEQTDYGFSIERNKDINRLQLKFDNIPDANTRAVLKSNGFRWSPREQAWQRQLNGNSEYSLKRVMEKMKAENALLEGIESILSEHNMSEDDLPLLEGLHNLLKD